MTRTTTGTGMASGTGRARTLRTAATASAAALVLGLAACSTGGSDNTSDAAQAGSTQGAGQGGGDDQPTPTTPPVQFDTSVQDKAEKVPVDTTVTARATEGTLTGAKLSYVGKKTGKTVDVPGTLDGGTWTAGDNLEPGVTYTLAMTAKDTAGDMQESTRTFQTVPLTLDEQTYVTVQPASGEVGIGMPVMITFDVPVKDHASFEKHMKVTSNPPQPGAWRWISDKEVHWRPAAYWKPGTKVHVDAKLNGVPAGNGIFGEQSRTADFTIGRAVVAETNFKTHQMTFKVDGKVVKTMPITGGKPATQTRSGIKVIMNKQENITMRAETIGYREGDSEWYPDSKVRWALQLTNSGEFIHTATWSVWAQGSQNVSHGCTGMNTANSGWVFQNMKVGDLVVASGTDRKMTLGNGIADWNYSFDQWKSGAPLT